MVVESVTPPSAFHQMDVETCVERDDLEEGEIEDDEIPDDVNIGKLVKNADIEWSVTSTNDHKSRNSLAAKEIGGTNVPLFSQSNSNATLSVQDISTLNSWHSETDNGKLNCTEGTIAAMSIADNEQNSCSSIARRGNAIPKSYKRKSCKNEFMEEHEDGKLSKKQKRNRNKTTLDHTVHVNIVDHVDDDEMLFIRGASPVIYKNDSPSRYYNESDYEFTATAHNNSYKAQRNSEECTGQVRVEPQIRRKRRPQRKLKIDLEGLTSTLRSNKKSRRSKSSKRPNRRMELCKFYMLGSCFKKDTCMYMHSDFPCKFYHTGLKCSAENRCKFKHGALNATMHSVLLNHLETAPDEIANFSRQSCEGAVGMTMSTNKKIPSLLEIKVPIPPQLLAKNRHTAFKDEDKPLDSREVTNVEEAGSRTPMPCSPRLETQNEVENFSDIQRWDIDDFVVHRHSMKQVGCSLQKDTEGQKMSKYVTGGDNVGGCTSWPPSLPPVACAEKEQCETQQHNSNIPHNLPKKQRELFLRIQQQQREVSDSNNQHILEENKSKSEGNVKEAMKEECWYSSDEEDESLASILKNLSNQPPFPLKSGVVRPSNSSISPSTYSNVSTTEISESVSKLLSSIKLKPKNNVANVAVNAPSKQKSEQLYHSTARDPRLTSRDPRNKNTITFTMPSVHNSTQIPTWTESLRDGSLGNINVYNASITTLDNPSMQVDGSFAGLESSNFGGGDVDLRKLLHGRQDMAIQSGTRHDVDLRQNMRHLISSTSFIYGNSILGGAGPSGDVDLREIMGLPFSPVPIHEPATEIHASLTSHAPISYRIIPITIPNPNYAGLKVNTTDPQVLSDPRLCKIFNLSLESTKRSVPLLPLFPISPACSSADNDLRQKNVSLSATQSRNTTVNSSVLPITRNFNTKEGIVHIAMTYKNAEVVLHMPAEVGNSENMTEIHKKGSVSQNVTIEQSLASSSVTNKDHRMHKSRNHRSKRSSQQECRSYMLPPRNIQK